MTTEREGLSSRTSWAELGRSSFEYILTRWFKRKEGRGASRVLILCACAARPSREDLVDTADSTRVASELGVKNDIIDM